MTRQCDCSHLKARHVLRETPNGAMFCPNCEKPVPVEWVVNSLLDKVRELEERVKKNEKAPKTKIAKIA